MDNAFVRIKMETAPNVEEAADIPVQDLALTQGVRHYLQMETLARQPLGVCRYYAVERNWDCSSREGCKFAHVQNEYRILPAHYQSHPVPALECSGNVLVVKDLDQYTAQADVDKRFAKLDGFLSANIFTKPAGVYALVEFAGHHQAVAAMAANTHSELNMALFGIQEQCLDAFTQLDHPPNLG